MRKPSFSIGGLMLFVAISALDFLVIRYPLQSRNSESVFRLLTLLPMANILGLALLCRIRARSRGDSPRRFLTGFLAVGGLIILFFAILLIQFGSRVLWTSYDRVTPLMNEITSVLSSVIPNRFLPRIAIAGVLITTIQLIPALLGGWIALHYEFDLFVEAEPISPEQMGAAGESEPIQA